MAVEVTLLRRDAAKYVEGPAGFYSVPEGLVENPVGSGLYTPPSYLVGVDGVYTIPDNYVGSGYPVLHNLKNFSVQEDATPIDPSSSFGGSGQISFDINDSGNATRLMAGQITLVNGSQGKTSGVIRSLSSSDLDVQVVADSTLSLFNTERSVPPYIGTFGGAIQHYCDLVGIQNDVVVDASLASRSVVYPGFVGDVWVNLKQILVVEQAEIALVFDRVYVRPLRTLTSTLDRSLSKSWSIENVTAARRVEINYYNHRYGNQVELFPAAADNPVTISGIGSGEEHVITVQLNGSVVSLNQPVPTFNVGNHSYEGTAGVYAVTGYDNLPIQPSQWLSEGGSLTVRMTDDPSVIEVVVRGAVNNTLAPYRIAMSAGSGSDYNSLHVTGTAVVYDKKSVTIPTGATSTTTSDEVGVVVDSPYISTLAQAHNLGLRVAGSHAGVAYTIAGTALDINRSEGGTDLIQATIADFNSDVPSGTTIGVFNAEWYGKSIADFNQYWQDRVDLLFDNQLFGNAIGSRVYANDAYFRVNSVTTTIDSAQFSASLDTLVSDFNSVWEDSTIADFNLEFAGYTCKDFSIVPLQRRQ